MFLISIKRILALYKNIATEECPVRLQVLPSPRAELAAPVTSTLAHIPSHCTRCLLTNDTHTSSLPKHLRTVVKCCH